MKTPSFIKNALYSWAVFFGTVILLSVGYAAWNATMGPVTSGSSLTATWWNALVDNITDLNDRVSGVTSSLSALQVSAGNLWAANGGNISYTGGNVGIGTTTPGALVHVYKESGNNAEIDIQSVVGANKHWGIYQDRTSESLKFWNSTAGGDMVTFTKDGNTGIGTASPSTKLEVVGEIKATSLTATDTNSQSTTLGALKLSGANGAIILDDGGQKRISWNDGGGNFNIRAGNYYQPGVGVSYTKWTNVSNGGAAVMTMSTDNADGFISMSTSAIGDPGTLVTWANSFSLAPTYTAFDLPASTWGYFVVRWGRSYFAANNEPFGIASMYNNNGGRVYFWASDGSTTPSAVISNNAGSALMTLQDAGNVGIGTSSPTQKLEVTGTVKATAFVGDGSGLTGVGGGVPAGAIMAFNLTSCPSGWSDYTPAYGRFLRGIDQTGVTTVDPSGKRAPGNIQADAFASHSHTMVTSVYWQAGANAFVGNGANGNTISTATAGAATETRPKNVAVLYCVKS